MCEHKVVRKFVKIGTEKPMHSLCPTNKANKEFISDGFTNYATWT